MNRRFSRLPALFRKQGRRKGVALIITLGIVALLLILVMSFAFDAQTSSQVSSVRNDDSVARLLARGGLERAIGFLSNELGDTGNVQKLNPALNFFTPGSGSDWAGRSYLPSVAIGTVHDTGLVDALHVAFSTGTGSVDFTPGSGTLLSSASWDTIVVARDPDGDGVITDTMIAGRVAYVLIDYTGAVDPAQIVHQDSDETSPVDWNLTTRTGGSMVDITMSHVVDPSPPNSNSLLERYYLSTDGGSLNATYPRWWSYAELARVGDTDLNQAKFDSMAVSLFPFAAQEPEEFWADGDDDSEVDPGELRSRLALDRVSVSIDSPTVYNLLIGYDATVNPNRNAGSYYSPWLRGAGLSTVDTTRIAAARLSMILCDYADSDRYLSYASIDATDGAITPGSYADDTGPSGTAGMFTVYGVENQPYLSELAVEFVVVMDAPGVGTDISCTPRFGVECYDPWHDASIDSVTVRVSYDYVIRTGEGDSLADAGQVSITMVQALESAIWPLYGGATGNDTANVVYNSSSTAGPTVSGTLAGGNAAGNLWYMERFSITEVLVKYEIGGTVYVSQVLPSHAQDQRYFWAQWTDTLANGQPGVAPAETYYAGSVSAIDPMMGMVDHEDSDFDTFWTVSPASGQSLNGNLAMTGVSGTYDGDIGNLPVVYGAAAALYGDVEEMPDAAFLRLGELGGLHSPLYPNQSVRLWASSSIDFTNHDAFLLDMFYIDADAASQRGRINVNTSRTAPLLGLFTGVADYEGDRISLNNAKTLVTALHSLNGTGGGDPMLYRGDLFRLGPTLAGIGPLGIASAADDNEAEDFVLGWVELTSTRYNHYVAIVNGQALQDLGPLPDAAGASIPGAIKWKEDGVNDRYMKVKSEQKILAYLQRDAFTNVVKILRVEVVD